MRGRSFCIRTAANILPFQVVIALPSPREKRPQRDIAPALAVGTPTAKLGTLEPEHEKTPPVINGNFHIKQPQEPEIEKGALGPDDAKPLMELTYDKLVYAVGTKTGTFGVPGVLEYCYMLKASRSINGLEQVRRKSAPVLGSNIHQGSAQQQHY